MINITEPNCTLVLTKVEINYTLIMFDFDIIHRSPNLFFKVEDITVSYPIFDDKQLLNAAFFVDIADVRDDVLEITFTDNITRNSERVDKFVKSMLERKFEVIEDYVVFLKLRRKRQTDRIV